MPVNKELHANPKILHSSSLANLVIYEFMPNFSAFINLDHLPFPFPFLISRFVLHILLALLYLMVMLLSFVLTF